jgi:hypothetical protein
MSPRQPLTAILPGKSARSYSTNTVDLINLLTCLKMAMQFDGIKDINQLPDIKTPYGPMPLEELASTMEVTVDQLAHEFTYLLTHVPLY